MLIDYRYDFGVNSQCQIQVYISNVYNSSQHKLDLHILAERFFIMEIVIAYGV